MSTPRGHQRRRNDVRAYTAPPASPARLKFALAGITYGELTAFCCPRINMLADSNSSGPERNCAPVRSRLPAPTRRRRRSGPATPSPSSLSYTNTVRELFATPGRSFARRHRLELGPGGLGPGLGSESSISASRPPRLQRPQRFRLAGSYVSRIDCPVPVPIVLIRTCSLNPTATACGLASGYGFLEVLSELSRSPEALKRCNSQRTGSLRRARPPLPRARLRWSRDFAGWVPYGS